MKQDSKEQASATPSLSRRQTNNAPSLPLQQTSTTPSLLLQQLIDYIELQLLEPITPADIAAHFYISVSSLNQMFRLFDLSPMEYIRNRRLSLAAGDLLTGTSQVISLAYKYQYETPEAFTKAFTRVYGYPPSLVRRLRPSLPAFQPTHITVSVVGGWELTSDQASSMSPSIQPGAPVQKTTDMSVLTHITSHEQENTAPPCYNTSIKTNGGIDMTTKTITLDLSKLHFKKEFDTLLQLTAKLHESKIPFKIDGKTMIFAHGLEFAPQRFHLTFRTGDAKQVIDFFHYSGSINSSTPGFAYFDVMFQGMQVRCMFYGNITEIQSEDNLYQNTDIVEIAGQRLRVQSLEFYYENASTKDTYYEMVAAYLNK